MKLYFCSLSKNFFTEMKVIFCYFLQKLQFLVKLDIKNGFSWLISISNKNTFIHITVLV